MDDNDDLKAFSIGFRAGATEALQRASARKAVIGAEAAAAPASSPSPPAPIVVYGSPPSAPSAWLHFAVGATAAVGVTALVVALITAMRRRK